MTIGLEIIAIKSLIFDTLGLLAGKFEKRSDYNSWN